MADKLEPLAVGATEAAQLRTARWKRGKFRRPRHISVNSLPQRPRQGKR